jgi:hypothetical protein
MSPSDGWILIGPLVAVTVAGFVSAVFWRLMPRRKLQEQGDPGRDVYAGGLAIFGEPDDYGLLCAAAVSDQTDVADEIRRLLRDAGIRATQAVGDDGRVAVLVFVEELEEARRLVGDTPAL